jgi:hypothetical protein
MKSFAYDFWGESVTLAELHQVASQPDCICICQTTYDLVCEQFECRPQPMRDFGGKLLKSYLIMR